MFGNLLKFICVATFLLVVAGCGVFSSAGVGVEPNETLNLDGEFELSESIEKGEIIALDMRVPLKSGYKIIGTSFDPDILSLVHFLTYDDDGESRVQYMFKALVDGSTDVLIKMQPIAGGDIEIYKRTTINVGEDDSLF